jgi:hypothetical protein
MCNSCGGIVTDLKLLEKLGKRRWLCDNCYEKENKISSFRGITVNIK